MDKCVWKYNMKQKSMGRVMSPSCVHYSWHGEILAHALNTYKYCPYCGKEIEFINEGE